MNQGTMLYIIVLIAAFYFLLIRPQQAATKKRAEMMNSLQPGAKIVTIGGICGVVAKVTDEKVFVEVADGVVIEMLRTAISTIAPVEEPADEEDEDDDLDDIDLDDIDLDDIDLDDDDLYYEEDTKESK